MKATTRTLAPILMQIVLVGSYLRMLYKPQKFTNNSSMPFNRSKYQIVRASDVSTRDGIGVEISYEGKLVCEIFRDDTERTRIVSLPSQEIPLEDLEGFIQIFKDEIDWDFIDYDEP